MKQTLLNKRPDIGDLRDKDFFPEALALVGFHVGALFLNGGKWLENDNPILDIAYIGLHGIIHHQYIV